MTSITLHNGNGRVLPFIQNESLQAIITDHPWSDSSNRGGIDHSLITTHSVIP